MAIIDINITTPNLQEVTDSGNTTNNDVAFTDNAGILLENTSRLREGTLDSGAGGGIAQICAVGYELKWEAGSQYVMDGNGTLIREVNHKFNTIPTSTNDDTQGFYVGSRWILDSGDVYICTDSTSTAAVWEIVPNADWNATGGSTAIANKPSIPSIAGLVPDTRNLTINGVTYDLSADRSWVIAATASTLQHEVKAGEAMTKGQAVYVSSADGTNMIVSKASNATEATSSKTMGLIIQTLATNGQGFVITEGLLAGLDTSTATAGDPVWLGTGGDLIYGLINKPAAPAHLVFIGIVTRANVSNGEIFVRVQNGFELQELHNVAITSVADNNLLQYDSATSLWKNKSITAAGIQPTLTSGTNIKTINGNSLLGSGDLVISGGGGSGIFGITNASGVYTYYATLTLAMAAATSGQTIEMFANVTETGAVTITLKNGVNINGNGYTYTLNNSGLIHAFSAANSVVTFCNINNLNVIRTGSTGSLFDNSCLILGINGSGIINCSGSTFRNSGSGCGILFNSNSAHEINYAVAHGTNSYGAIGIFSNSAKLNNSIGYATSGGTGIRCHTGGDIQNCTGISDSGYGIYGLNGNQSNSVGISTSGSGFLVAANAYNCVGRSISSVGLEVTNAINAVGCVGISVSGVGLSLGNALMYNCTGISSSSRGTQIIGTSKAYNLTSKSTSSYSMLANSPTVEIHNSTIICEWNNAGGIGISSNNTTIPTTILNSTFILSNASAPYLFNNTNAQAISTRGNTYRGGGAYSVLITQAIVTTEDAQGNIFL